MSRTYGKTPVAVDDMQRWAKHDHPWGSGGQVEKVLDIAISQIESIISEETKAAIADYASASEMGLGVSPDGHLLVGVRLHNEDADIIIKVPFLRLVQKALVEIKPTIATDDDQQALFSALVNVGRELEKLGRAGVPTRPVVQRSTSHQANAVGSVARRPQRAVPADSVVG